MCIGCSTAELRPQLDNTRTRLDDVRNKHTNMKKQLETLQNNMNVTTSTCPLSLSHPHTHHRHTHVCNCRFQINVYSIISFCGT